MMAAAEAALAVVLVAERAVTRAASEAISQATAAAASLPNDSN